MTDPVVLQAWWVCILGGFALCGAMGVLVVGSSATDDIALGVVAVLAAAFVFVVVGMGIIAMMGGAS